MQRDLDGDGGEVGNLDRRTWLAPLILRGKVFSTDYIFLELKLIQHAISPP